MPISEPTAHSGGSVRRDNHDPHYIRCRSKPDRWIGLVRIVLMGFQDAQLDKLKHRHVRGLQNHRRRVPGNPCLFPPAHTQTPTISGLQPRKPVFRPWSDQIVATSQRKLEELPGDPGTHGVQSQIARSGSAVAVPVKTRKWFPATAPQLSSQNICTHTALLS